MDASKSDRTETAAKLREMTPAPMNTMVEKQPREEAVQKRICSSMLTSQIVSLYIFPWA